MNLKDFKAVSQDKDSYTIQHPSGKMLRVEKAGLHRGAHSAIKHLYQGGQSDGADAGSNAGMDQRISDLGGGDPMAGFKANALQKGAAAGAPAPVAAEPEDIQEDRPNGFTRSGPLVSAKDKAAMQAIKDKEGPVPGDADYVSSGPTEEQAVARAQSEMQGRGPDGVAQDPLLQEKSGVGSLLEEQVQQQEEALASGQAAGKKIANIQEGEAAALGKLPSYNDIVAGYQAKDQKLAQDYADAKIDPQHLIHSMGTGSKILTGIGMVLSGMGSATTGQPSYAMQVLHDAIDRDVDAQKNDQSKKMNLWKMNREAMGNDAAANLATENQIKAGVLAKLQAAQTRAALPQEKLRAQQAVDQLKMEMLQNNLRRGLLTQGVAGAQSGGGGGALSVADPSMLVPEMVKDPAQQKAVYEEIKNRANIVRNGGAMLKAFDQAANEVSGAGGVLHSAIEKTPGQLALDQLMKPNMSELDGTIRHEAVAGAQETMIPSFKDLGRADRIASKRQSLIDWMKSQQAAPVSKGNYIDLDRFKSTAIPNGEAPPTAPAARGAASAAKQTQIMHGHTYQKVQGGWKLVK